MLSFSRCPSGQPVSRPTANCPTQFAEAGTRLGLGNRTSHPPDEADGAVTKTTGNCLTHIQSLASGWTSGPNHGPPPCALQVSNEVCLFGINLRYPLPGPHPAHQLGRVVALLIVLGNFATGGGGGRDRSGHGWYLSDHGSGQIRTVLDSFSSSVSSVSGLPTQHLVEIAIPIYCERASSSSSTLASSERQHAQSTQFNLA